MRLKICIQSSRGYWMIMPWVTELYTWNSALAVCLQEKQTYGMHKKCVAKMYGIPLMCFGPVTLLLQHVICLREKARLLVILQSLLSVCVSPYLQSWSSSKEGDARMEKNKCFFMCWHIFYVKLLIYFGGVKVLWKHSTNVTVKKTYEHNRNLSR